MVLCVFFVDQHFRLFNQSAGMNSQYESDDKYNIYDNRLFEAQQDKSFYKFDKDRVEEMNKKTARVFEGTGEDEEGKIYNVREDGPVEFERDEPKADPFGVDRAFKKARKN